MNDPSPTAASRTGGRAAEIEALYRTDGARLWKSIYGYAASRAVADDAVAEAFAQLLGRGDAVRDPRAWVWRSAFRIAAGELQSRRRTVNELAVDVTEPDATHRSDDAVDLANALQRLSDMQRKALVLHEYAGYRAAEVARIIGSTEAAVRVHLLRGRRAMRKILGD